MRAIIFGVGYLFDLFMDVYNRECMEIIALCDNNKNIWGTEKYGIQVIPPERIDRNVDRIIITSSYYEEIRKQLESLGVQDEKIIDCSSESKIVESDFAGNAGLHKYYYEKNKKLIEEIKPFWETQLMLTAKNMIFNICQKKQINDLAEVEFKVFSQFGEDGIIQWLIHNVEVKNKIFVEFGVEDYTEANTRFLLMNDNWSGLIIDGSEKNIDSVRNRNDYWKYDLTAVAEFITKDNINTIIQDAGFNGEIGILSVDIDGNDYWVLKNITCVNPVIIICEYNNVFGPDEAVSVPYDECFDRTEKHFSNLYWGASLQAFCLYAEENDYYYVGSNSAGNNAFFVRKDCIDIGKINLSNICYKESKYRESRDRSGKLTYLKGRERLCAIKEMELVDLKTGEVKQIKEIYKL